MSRYHKNASGIPDILHRWLCEDDHWRPDGVYASVSELCGPQWQRWLREWWYNPAHWQDDLPPSELYQDSALTIKRKIGSAVHADFERFIKGWAGKHSFLSETQLEGEICGRKISGTCDLFDQETRQVIDIKTGSRYKLQNLFKGQYDSPGRDIFEWRMQLSLYAQLLYQNGHHMARSGKIWLILTDFSAGAYDGIDSPIHEVDINLFSVAELATEVQRRIDQFERYNKSTLRPEMRGKCSDVERWSKDTAYSVRKEGRKSALRNLPTYSDAVAWCEEHGLVSAIRSDGTPQLAKGHSIEHKPASDTRCAKHCDVSHFCGYWQCELDAAEDRHAAAWYAEAKRVAALPQHSTNGVDELDDVIPF